MYCSKRTHYTISKRGFSLIEVILASAIFALLITAIVGGIIYGRESTAISGSRARAIAFAEEGIEATRNLRDQSFGNLTDGNHGLTVSLGQWFFSGVSDVNGVFTRQIAIGTLNENTKNVTSTVTWQQTPSRPGSIVISSRLTNWRAPKPRGGMLVFGDGGTTQDFIRYKTIDPTGVWSGASLAADVDPATTNKSPRAVQVYSSATRNEKVVISRHLAGTNGQTIYAQVYDGLSWGNVVLLSSWTSNTFIDVQNFSGAYLANGDFMVVYSDNTTTPKFRVWNGTSWTAQIASQNIVGIPNYIVARTRPDTNEVMVAFFDQGSDTNTEYFNGGAYVAASWTLHTEHSAVAPLTTKQFVNFVWSPNTTTKGALIFSDSATDTTLALRIWTANGAGGGSWSATVNSAASGGRLGAMAIDGRKGADEFLSCQKDANNDIYCFRGNSTPAWATPTNNILTATSHTGIQRSFHLAYEAVTGNLGLAVYSDNTATPKYRKYNPVTNAFDAVASSITVAGGGVLTAVRLVPLLDTDDIMILMGDANNDLRSIVWDGTSDALYTTPSGKALNLHGITGSATADFWFDFAWDRY